MKTTPYWLAEPREEHASPATRGRPSSRAADVVVVGGGVTGCSCALTLAEHGLHVRLLEGREIAAGASGRNGGFALRGAATSYPEARLQLGRERARALWELTERSLDRLEAIAGDACRRVGSIRLAVGDAEAVELERELETLRADGFSVERLEPLSPVLARRYTAGLVHPRDAALQPPRWVRRLAARAAAAGAELVEGRPVAADELPALRADEVVVAADALAPSLLPELVDVVWPLRGQLLATEPLRPGLFERPHYARGGFDYWQQLRDGRLVAGGKRDASFSTERTAVEEPTRLIQERLEELVLELLGELPRITHRWAGVWGETRDRLPLVGRVPGRDRVWFAGGYSGHGNVLGLACGDLLARAILGEQPPELELFDPARVLAAAG